MSPNELEKYCPNYRFLSVARLEGYKLDFTRHSERRNSGVGNIIPSPGSAVWGVLYEISDNELPALDKKEGCPKYYKHQIVLVMTEESIEIEAMTYTVVEKGLEFFPPSKEYISLLIEGAYHWGLPKEYIEFLKSIPAIEEEDERSERRESGN